MTSDKYILGPDGRTPVVCADTRAWGQWFEDNRHMRVVAQDQLASGVEVSTVFLGLDHQYGSGGPPILFETLVFNGPFDGTMRRTSTWDDAETEHAKVIARVTGLRIDPEDDG